MAYYSSSSFSIINGSEHKSILIKANINKFELSRNTPKINKPMLSPIAKYNIECGILKFTSYNLLPVVL